MIRSYLAALGLAALSGSALAACPNDPPVHTQNAVVVDSSGAAAMVVIPTDDCELDQPAFNPPGLTQLRVSVNGNPIANAAQISPAVASSLSTIASAAASVMASASLAAAEASASIAAMPRSADAPQ